MLMLTGIMAMFEMATSFNSQQIQFRPLQRQDAYSGSAAKQADRDLLKLFSQEKLLHTLGDEGKPWAGQDLCAQLMCRVNLNAQDGCTKNNGYDKDLFENSPLQKNNYLPGEQTKSNAVNLSGACVLTAGSHRILVVPNFEVKTTPPYRLYSCLTSQDRQQCLFETSN